MLSQSVEGHGFLSGESGDPLWMRIVYACYAFTEYLFKCCFPYKLLYLYPFPNAGGGNLPSWLLFYPLLLIIAVVFLWRFLKNRLILFGILFFVIHIAISLHIIPMSRFAIVADRYVYISSLGICFLFSCGIVTLYRMCRRLRVLLVTICVLFIVCLGIYANSRSRVWHDVNSLKKELRDLLRQRADYKKTESFKRD